MTSVQYRQKKKAQVYTWRNELQIAVCENLIYQQVMMLLFTKH